MGESSSMAYLRFAFGRQDVAAPLVPRSQQDSQSLIFWLVRGHKRGGWDASNMQEFPHQSRQAGLMPSSRSVAQNANDSRPSTCWSLAPLLPVLRWV